MFALVWERMEGRSDDNGKIFGYFRRAKVLGGWLVMAEHEKGVGITFVPDPSHAWTQESVPLNVAKF